jgi:hypothetical protein
MVGAAAGGVLAGCAWQLVNARLRMVKSTRAWKKPGLFTSQSLRKEISWQNENNLFGKDRQSHCEMTSPTFPESPGIACLSNRRVWICSMQEKPGNLIFMRASHA